MLFFPFKADIRLPGIPLLTILITIACLYIYWLQFNNDLVFYKYTSEFCAKTSNNKHKLVMNKLSRTDIGFSTVEETCRSTYITIHTAPDKAIQIKTIADNTEKFSSKSLEQSHRYIENYLAESYDKFRINAPELLTNKLSYNPKTYNPVNMITSTFAHGGWDHVIGNLFFFFAFAATIEAILGILIFPLYVVALGIGTNLIYSLAVMASPEALPTVGLSGVVMGMMGLFTYFVPTARIKCFFWFLIIIRKFAIPAWLLALWYFGWDVYALTETGTSGNVNLVAHVSGFIMGYLIGFVFFRKRKRQVHAAAR